MRRLLAVLAVCAVATPALAGQWPPKPGTDWRKPANWPNDGGYAQCAKADKSGVCTEVSGGDWNLWSWTPANYAAFPGFRKVEVKMGVGMHADRAWEKTIGDRRVRIAVLDSGIKWDNDDLVNKHYLNRGELPEPDKACRTKDFKASDPYDTNGDGIFNMADWVKEGPEKVPGTPCDPRVKDANGNGIIDPGDLIELLSDGKDDDGNGYIDDISGWDFFRDDNNPYDDTRFGHGTGEARDSSAEGNNGRGSLGVCPECTVIMVRVADSFVCDINDFGAAVIFAVDSGADVLQEALGSINNTPYAVDAIEYAYRNNVAIVASAADELSFHHNFPGSNNHTLYVHAIVYDGNSPKTSTTFLNFNNCTNYGGNLLLSTPGTGCSSEATGMTSGHVGLIYSAALQAKLDPPLSAEEVRGILVKSSDDIDVPESKTDPSKFPSGPGWDLHFGYGRNNVYRSVSMVLDDEIPPDVDIAQPRWFEPIEVGRTPKVEVIGRVGKRADGRAARYKSYDWVLEYAKGVDPKSGWKELKKGTTPGLEGKLAEIDVAEIAAGLFDFTAPLLHHDQYTLTLRLRATAKTAAGKVVRGEFRKSIGLYRDPDLLPGFPKKLATSVEASPKLFDLDCDGRDEIIQPTSDGSLHAWKADGSEAAGWPVQSPVRREFDSGYKFNTLKACAYRKDKKGCRDQGKPLPGRYHETMIINSPAVGDVDGDGRAEVVATTYDGTVMVLKADGTPLHGFPVRTDPKNMGPTSPDKVLDDGICGSPVLADLDSDGKLEIVVAAMDQHLYVWNHDGSLHDGFPVLVSDPAVKGKMRARIISTPAVGDVDGDGQLDIVLGTNEVFGAAGVKNESRGYVVYADGNKHAGGPFHKGWPVKVFGLMAEVLPLVGKGVPGNPALVDIDLDGKLEINLDSIGSAGLFYRYDGSPYRWKVPGKSKKLKKLNNLEFGAESDTKDSPAYILIASGSLGKIDRSGGVDFVKATAGFNFALTFASGGKRADFDHHLTAWDTLTGRILEGWPRVMEDWQFFSNPAIVDINGDDDAEVIASSAGYLLHAWNYLGKEPTGFPKYTGGWMLSSVGLGDVDGDGNWDLAAGTRDGMMFAWRTSGKRQDSVNEWTWYGHDLHNTGNYHAPLNPYAEQQAECRVGASSGGADSGTGSSGADAGSGSSGGASSGGASSGGSGDGGCAASRAGDGAGRGLLWLLLAGLGIMALLRRTGARG